MSTNQHSYYRKGGEFKSEDRPVYAARGNRVRGICALQGGKFSVKPRMDGEGGSGEDFCWAGSGIRNPAIPPQNPIYPGAGAVLLSECARTREGPLVDANQGGRRIRGVPLG